MPLALLAVLRTALMCSALPQMRPAQLTSKSGEVDASQDIGHHEEHATNEGYEVGSQPHWQEVGDACSRSRGSSSSAAQLHNGCRPACA